MGRTEPDRGAGELLAGSATGRELAAAFVILAFVRVTMAEHDMLPDGTRFVSWEVPTACTRAYHVAQSNPAADDENPGTEERPWFTIGHAAPVLQPGERVVIHAGVYREWVKPARGGDAPDRMIAYEAAPGEGVVLKGSDLWTPEWEPTPEFPPPSFGIKRREREQAARRAPEDRVPGLLGSWYGNADLTRQIADEVLASLTRDWSSDTVRGGAWSGRWLGEVEAPFTGEVTLSAEADRGVRVEVAGESVVDAWEGTARRSGTLALERGRRYPIGVSYSHVGGPAYLRVKWSWEGQDPVPVPDAALSHRAGDGDGLALGTVGVSGRHQIGFRVVQAPMPETEPLPADAPFVRVGVKGERSGAKPRGSCSTISSRRRRLRGRP